MQNKENLPAHKLLSSECLYFRYICTLYMLIQPYCMSLPDNGQDILQVIRCSEFRLSHSKRVEPNSETSQLGKKLVMHSAKAINVFCQTSFTVH